MSGFAVLFYALAFLTLLSALGVIGFRNPVYSALSLVVTLASLAGLYTTLHAGFLAVIQVLTYAGAIMVLFVFIIMLLNLEEKDLVERGPSPAKKIAIAAAGAGCLGFLGWALLKPIFPIVKIADDFGSVRALGRKLFTEHVLSFEIAGVLLTVALVGAVLLAKKKLEEAR